jgi:uridine phosphorylase
MSERSLPILEHDFSRPAVTEPGKIIKAIPEMPEHTVLVFYEQVIKSFVEQGLFDVIRVLRGETGDFPVYGFEHAGKRIAVINPGLGAPSAGGILEEVIALGAKKVIACGSAGVLKKELPRGKVIVVESALRDEGTSYHYLPPSEYVETDREVLNKITEALSGMSIDYTVARTWTTDGIFRETPSIVKRRLSQGCLVVEMEASALIAVSRFRGIEFGQLLSCGDDVSGVEWDRRLDGSVMNHKEKLFYLAATCCSKL